MENLTEEDFTRHSTNLQNHLKNRSYILVIFGTLAIMFLGVGFLIFMGYWFV